MSILDLSNELLLQIVEPLDSRQAQPNLNSLARVCKHLYQSLNNLLYVNNVRFLGSISLLWAAKHGQEQTVRRFLQLGANVNVTNEFPPGFYNLKDTKTRRGETSIDVAARAGNLAIVKLLLDAGASTITTSPKVFGADEPDAGWMPLLNAIRGEHEIVAREIYAAMGEVPLDVLPQWNYAAMGKVTPLHAACMFDIPDLVRFFLLKGTDVDLRAGSRRTPLYYAIYHGKPRVVDVLLEFGADPDLEMEEMPSFPFSSQERNIVTPRTLTKGHQNQDIAKMFKEDRDWRFWKWSTKS